MRSETEEALSILRRVLLTYTDQAGQHHLLQRIDELSQQAGISYPARTGIVYRAIPGLDEYFFTEAEIIEYDLESGVVSTSHSREAALEFIEDTPADWGYLLTYRIIPDSVVVDFDYLIEEYGWDELSRGEKEILIDVERAELVDMEKVH